MSSVESFYLYLNHRFDVVNTAYLFYSFYTLATKDGFMERDRLTHQVIGAAIEVHRHLGPGLLESCYEQCLVYELEKLGLNVQSQVCLPVNYKDLEIESAFRIDLLIPEQLVIEIKSINDLRSVHTAQLLTYMKLANIAKGLLINFNTIKLINGVKRLVL
jgi:GxxExxY protein